MAIRSTFTTGEVLTAADLTDTIKGAFINTETTTARTLGTADAGNLVTLNNNSGGTVTIPTNTTWGSPLGTLVHLINIGTAGSFTVGTAAGVTLNAASATLAIREGGTLIKTATNTWQFVKQSAPPADPGLAFITRTTFTTSSAVNVNNCFSSTYDNYRVVGNITGTASTTIGIRMRVGGVDNSTASSYIRERLVGDGSAVSAGMATDSQFSDVLAINTAIGPQTVEFLAPALAVPTGLIVVGGRDNQVHIVSGRHNQSTIYDGFSLIPVTGTITGTIRIYGYRNE